MGKRNHCILEQVLVEKSSNTIRFLAIDAVVKEILGKASRTQYQLEEQVVHMKNEFGKGKGEYIINLKLLRQFVFGVKAVLNSMATMFRGIVRKKVVKACFGKFHPLFQFFYFELVQSLSAEPLDPSDFKPLSSCYDAQISVFGLKLQKKLEDAKMLLVGFEASGCEFQKNVALMGVSCGSQGKRTITDDVIEKSNLSRQFLFRDWTG